MQKINFNHTPPFNGFKDGEEILLDSGILLAYLNKYDTWHNTVDNLFKKHLINTDSTVELFVNSRIVDEVFHLSKKPLHNYNKAHGITNTLAQIEQVTRDTQNNLRALVSHELVTVLDGNKDTVLKQIDHGELLGSTDSLNVSIANAYEINFLTCDTRLANKVYENRFYFTGLEKLYFTTPDYITY